MTNTQYETVVRTRDVRKFVPFEGRHIDEMPKLLAEGRTLITPKQLETVRLSGHEADKKYLRGNYVDVNVAIVPNPDGKEVKYVHNHPLIQTLNPKTKLKSGALSVSQEQYDGCEGFILSKSEVEEFENNNYALPNKRHEFWEFLAEGDTKLSKAYEKDVCDTLNLTFDKVMGLWMPRLKGLRLLCVGSVDGDGRSDAYGLSSLVNGNGRLVGVAPEALAAPKNLGAEVQEQTKGNLVAPTLEQVLEVSGKFAADMNKKELKQALENLYKQ